jgi:hypothetical protein
MSQPKKKVKYEAAISKAWEDLILLDPLMVSKNSGASYDPENDEYKLTFLGDEHHISPSKRTLKTTENQDLNPFLVVLLLHYLIHSKDLGPSGKLISFRELEGGDVYYSAFCARSINPITDSFGSELGIFQEVGERIGAEQGDLGDVSIIINVFPKIPVTVILWEGDDEVLTSSNMLFDSSIKAHLPTEDVAVIGGFVASKLIKNIRNSQKV